MTSAQHRGPGRRTRPSGRWWLAGGAVAAVLYLGTVMFAWPFPIRLLYDGLVPLPPYRWVQPPLSRAKDNRPPLSGAGTVTLGSSSQAVEISTDDDQALVTLPQGIIAPRSGEASVKVTIVPLDPVAVAPAPGGRRFDGNAYRIEALYAASGEQAVLNGSPTVVLRYPVHATLMLRSSEREWIPLNVQLFTGSQQALARTDRLGVFAAAALYNSRADAPAVGAECLGVAVAAVGLCGALVARRL